MRKISEESDLGSARINTVVEQKNGQKQLEDSAAAVAISKTKTPSALALIFFTVLIDLIGFGLIIQIMPSYARKLHASDLNDESVVRCF